MKLLRRALLALACCLVQAAASAAPPTGERLAVGVDLSALRDATRAEVEVSFRLWAEELMRTLEVPAEILFYADTAAIRRDFEQGKVNFVIAEGLSLLHHFSRDELADGLGGLAAGEDSLLLLVRRDAGIDGPASLAGKRLLLLTGNELSDLWLDTYCLRNLQRTCGRAGIKVQREKSGRQQVMKLFFGQVDAALVRGHVFEVAKELNPQIRDRIVVLETSRIYPSALGLFSSRVSLPFREYTINKATELNDYPRGRQLLSVMQTDRVGRVSLNLLEPIAGLLRENQSLRRKGMPSAGTPR
jgi:ABC-type phosphate/phosphonate transport system substrate-binding protein